MPNDPLGKINANVGKAQSWLDKLKAILALIGMWRKTT